MTSVNFNRRRRARDDRHQRAKTDRLSRFERGLFSFMGPPQLGEHKAREGYTPDPQADLCHKCGQPWDQHERVRTSNMTYTTCPEFPRH